MLTNGVYCAVPPRRTEKKLLGCRGRDRSEIAVMTFQGGPKGLESASKQEIPKGTVREFLRTKFFLENWIIKLIDGTTGLSLPGVCYKLGCIDSGFSHCPDKQNVLAAEYIVQK